MSDRSTRPDWLLWLESHPLLTLLFLSLVSASALIAVVTYLDHRIEERDTDLVLKLRPVGEPTGAVPSEMPHRVAEGQTVYVPMYSHILEYEGQRMPLAGTLSIRNTDSEKSLTISSVQYYDTEGKLIRDYLEQPLKLNPMGSTDIFIPQSDMAGGAGANFIVEWVAEELVHEPVVEAVMVGRGGTGITSFVRPGKVIDEFERD